MQKVPIKRFLQILDKLILCVIVSALYLAFNLFLWSPMFEMWTRMKNPHLRAKLAEVLEAVMPHMEPLAPGAAQPNVFQRENVFCSYAHAPQLAEALITVFVDIEFTGGWKLIS